MTVAELISALQAFPPDRPVEAWHADVGDWMDVEEVFLAVHPSWPHPEPSVRISP